MANIIYYLGAGASANAISTVEEMTDRIGLFAFMLEKYWIDLQKLGNIDEIGPIAFKKYKNDYRTAELKYIPYKLKEFIEELKYFIYELEKKGSIDIYARALGNGPEEKWKLKRLKKILYLYLNWEEAFSDDILDMVLSPLYPTPISKLTKVDFENRTTLIKKNAIFYEYYEKFAASLRGDKDIDIKDTLSLKKEMVDQRYVNFFISILTTDETTKKTKFSKEKIKIISWNYDNQIELAYDESPFDKDFFENTIKPNIKKLNGSCDSKYLISKYDFKGLLLENNVEDLKDAYKKSMNKLAVEIWATNERKEEEIKFVWEWEDKDDGSNDKTPSVSNANESDDANDNMLDIIDNEFNNSNDNRSLEEKVAARVNARAAYNEERKKERVIIVVIGYSFPSANEKIDKDILLELIRDKGHIQYFPSLTEIYIQVPSEKEFNSIKNEITGWIFEKIFSQKEKEIKNINFYHQDSREKFFIPRNL